MIYNIYFTVVPASRMKITGLVFVCLLSCIAATAPEIERLVNAEGHLQKLGVGRPVHDLDQFDGFPYPRWFFRNYVHSLKPLVLKNAAKLSPAFTKWTDDYLLQQEEPPDHTITVELKKKENRTFGVEQISFKKFLQTYNDSDIYMVNGIPPFIASDVVLPGPLQCDSVMETLVDAVMWFSSGGTKSVVHTDSVDNINCLFRGEKEFLFVDPVKYGDKVDIDHPEGAFSDVDVDRVDFTKYPGLADVEYYRIFLEPGDCLFIPYKWIHQVRSYGSNVAVNVWWDHFTGTEVDVDQCPDKFDPDLTMDKVTLNGFDGTALTIPAIRDHIGDYTRHKSLDLDGAVRLLIGNTKEVDAMDPNKGYEVIVKEIFLLLDKNRNNKIEHEEVENAEDSEWEKIIELMDEFDKMMAALYTKWEQLHPGEKDTLDEPQADGRLVDEL